MSVYDAAYLAATPLLLPGMLWKRWRHGKYRESLPGMLGRQLPNPPFPPPTAQRAWLHSVSVGETVAASSVCRELRRQVPEWEVLSTTTTETGQAEARRRLPEARHAYAPADFSWIVKGFHEAYRPTLSLIFETEIWPNALLEAGRRGVPVFLVNGKLSERSARGYGRLGGLIREPLRSVTRFYLQTEQDAERFARLLGEDQRLEVAGNVKFDALPEPMQVDERSGLRAEWGWDDEDLVLLFGSTHPTEEEIALEAWRDVRAEFPQARLVIAPRHPERFGAVAESLGRLQGVRVRRASRGPALAGEEKADVLLLDAMGVLARAYGAADVAAVAGSWVTVGGHNLLEPAVHAVPVLFGPHLFGQKDILRVLSGAEGALQREARDVGGEVKRLFADRALRERLGQSAQEAALANRGAARRVVEDIVQRVPGKALLQTP